MKAPIAHISPTLAAAAAGVLVWLAVFVLPGSEGHPVPLVPVIQGAAGAVAAPAEAPAAPAKPPARKAPATPARAATVAPSRPTVPGRTSHPARPKPARPVHRPAPVQAPVQSPAQQAVIPLAVKPGKGLGRNEHAASPSAVATQAPGHAKPKVRGHGHTPPGQAKKGSATKPAPALKQHPAQAHGGGRP